MGPEEGRGLNKTIKYLEADGYYNASLGCTESAYIDQWYAMYTIKSANFPGPIGPGEACDFNFLIPEQWAGINGSITFWCDTFQLNTNDKYGCGYRGLNIWNDEYENVICDMNFNTTS